MSWDELVATALVGTARRPPALPGAANGSELDAALAAVDRSDPEIAVLQAGATLGLYRQAGWRPPVDRGPGLPVCAEEGRLRCSQAAAFRFDSILRGRFRLVLGEWLGLAVEAGRLVPPDRLPSLLDAASADADLRGPTVVVIGERGRWLAGLNRAWAWAAGGGDADVGPTWATGAAAARRLLLERLRATDPGAARELLASAWSTEGPEDRAAFVAMLVTNLSMEDEPFLEAALDDRRREVRGAAVDLLWRLPGSRLAARMAARALALVHGSRKGLAISFPDEVDRAMARDGIVAKPPAGQGARAWWLHQLVAATPLETWTDASGEPPARLAQRHPELRPAWASAAARQRNEEWAMALLEAGDVHEPGLIAAVPHERAVQVALDRVTRLGLTPAVLVVLDRCPPPWGADLSGSVVERLGAVVRRDTRPDAHATSVRALMAGTLAVRLDPSVAARAAEELAGASGWWSDVVSWFVDLLTFRAEMREELVP